ncbi:MAG: PIG-L family deacetylase, partial [Proteobacteria bacterium]|nr:PIG-L family deacetylase [Pseudomonadota bacterium]
MNILGVGAHFDDLELGCSGTLINHVEKGDTVIMLVVTNSAYHDENGKLVRSAEDAMQEGIHAAELIGARMICLEYATFEVPFNEDLTSKIHKVINDNKIDAIYSHWIHDIHRDHEFVGRCTLMAGRHVPRFLMYRSNHYDSIQAFPGNIYSDIS